MTKTASVDTRRTVQKQLVRHALESATGFISAQHLHHRLEGQGSSIGLATVYRHLNALAVSGEADTVQAADGQLFRACTPHAHHHHLMCENCGKTVEIDAPSEQWINSVAEHNGYTVTRHVLEIFGLCPDCAALNGNSASPRRRNR